MELGIFLDKVRSDCSLSGVEFIHSKNERVHYFGSQPCNGFFEPMHPLECDLEHILNGCHGIDYVRSGSVRPVLAVAQGNKSNSDFLALLAHEYCHMQQFKEESPFWMPADRYCIWELWLSGESVEELLLASVWKEVVLLEANCEQRVVDMIKSLDLELNAELYAQKANSYLFFHTWALKNRSFYTTAPYEIEELVQHMPKALQPFDAYVQGHMAVELLPLFDLVRDIR